MVDVQELLEADWEELIEELIAAVELHPDSHDQDACLMDLEWLRDTCLDREKQSRYNMSKPKTILSINAGSSSLKITLFSVKNESPDIKSHNDAFQHILDGFLNDKDLKDVTSKDDITYACHRVVHGGDYATDQLINEQTYHKIEELEDLAPLSVCSFCLCLGTTY
jgi:hypothetical protein